MRATDNEAALRVKIAKTIGMVGSSSDHEALTAARMADKLVREAGFTWLDLIVGKLPEPEHINDPRQGDLLQDWPEHWAAAVEFCVAHRGMLNPASASFVGQLMSYDCTPSERQTDWLRRCVTHILRRTAAT
jgi:hypothetical protein